MKTLVRQRYGIISSLLASGLLLHSPAQAQATDAIPADEDLADEDLAYEGVAEVEAPPREPTKRELPKERLTTVPGTRGDALRAIEIMPGVGRTQFATNAGPPLLRGSWSNESLVLIDGVQAPLLYHFGGITSFFNSHLLESVTLYPGNYSARYGRAAGGAVEVRVRDPKSDRIHAMLELSAIDSFALVEGPVSETTSLALAARRSNVDLFFDALISEDSTAVIAAPVYWDYQIILAHRFDDAHKLRVIAYGDHDAFELYLGEAAAGDPGLAGEFGTRLALHRLQLEFESHFTHELTQKFTISGGPSPGRGRVGDVQYDFETWGIDGRAEWSLLPGAWLRVDAGLDMQMTYATFSYQGPLPPPEEGLPSQGSLASESTNVIDSHLNAFRPAAFIEASIRPVPSLLIVPGVRADYYHDVGDWSVDPRLASRLTLGASTTLKGGVGYYSQPPQIWEAMPAFGNPEVEAFRTLQTSAGVEQVLGAHVRTDVDVFYKHWEDRIVSTKGGAPPRYVNAGTGDAYGAEFLLDIAVVDRNQTYVSYTLSRSTREDAGQATRLFDRDQTHNLSLATNYDFGHGFSAGARFRYVTGNPYTAPRASVYDASTDTYRPLYAGLNQERHGAFHQLDLRVEKLWQVGPIGLTAYLEVMNVYNAENAEGRRYSFDYRESASVVGMPFFPNIGLRGEL